MQSYSLYSLTSYLSPISLSISLSMASHSLQPIHHNPLRQHRHPPATLSSALPFLKPSQTTTTTTISLSHSLPLTPHSLSPSITATPSTPSSATFDVLRHHLASQNFRQADEETRRLVIVLAGEAAQGRGYVFFSEAQFICASDLKTIDELWREHSGGRFGYSVQKKIWKRVNRDFTNFFIKVGWMKKLDTEVEQYNYRAFPNEFVWELNEETPEGHLPLTNALRGTQLLSSILSHPAFEEGESEGGESEGEEKEESNIGGAFSSKANLSKVFKTDYSF